MRWLAPAATTAFAVLLAYLAVLVGDIELWWGAGVVGLAAVLSRPYTAWRLRGGDQLLGRAGHPDAGPR